MCQAYEAERNYVVSREKDQIIEKWESYQRGEIDLTDDEIKSMVVRMIMLREQ